MAKYKIVLDTNIVHDDSRQDLSVLFRSDLDDLSAFLKSNAKLANVMLALPEMVMNERIAQRILQIESAVTRIEASFDGLKGFGITTPPDHYKKEDYKKALQDKAYEAMMKYDVEVLKTPTALQEKLIERALRKVKPFGKEKDAGFKDTVIWLTLLDDAAKNDDVEYIFCTDNDADFNAEEFKTLMGRDLKMVKNIGALKEYLDDELVLDLKLKALYKEIEGIIKSKHIPEIMMKINRESKFLPSIPSRSITDLLNVSYGNPYYRLDYPGSTGAPTIGYKFKDMTFRNISQKGRDTYEIDLDVSVIPVKKEDSLIEPEYMRSYFATIMEAPATTFSLKIEFHKNTDAIEIQTSEESFFGSLAGQ